MFQNKLSLITFRMRSTSVAKTLFEDGNYKVSKARQLLLIDTTSGMSYCTSDEASDFRSYSSAEIIPVYNVNIYV